MMEREHKDIIRMIDGYEPPEGNKKEESLVLFQL